MIPAGGRVVALALLAGTAACGAAPAVDGPAADPASITVERGAAQLATAGTSAPEPPTVVVRDAAGMPRAGVRVTFAPDDGSWVEAGEVVTDAAGRAATVWHAGPRAGAEHRLRATAGSLAAEFTLRTTPLVPGTTYAGTHGYSELLQGTLPLVISVPHGGSLTPAGMPDRSGDVTTITDAHTIELAQEVSDAFARRTGQRPSLVISRLHRRKLDPNREIGEAAQGSAPAERAWREYHGFIDAARQALADAGVAGLYIDLHGHGHDVQRLELGYLLGANDLALSDATLDSPTLVAKSSLRALVGGGRTHAQLVRGALSVGGVMEQRGYAAVPSPAQPEPGLAPFFSGGYSTSRHASREGTRIAGFQLEANMRGVRDTPEHRRAFADALVDGLLEFTAAAGVPLQAAGGATSSRRVEAQPSGLVTGGR